MNRNVQSLLSVPTRKFTGAWASAANSVSIVTTAGEGGTAGLTVSSVCSVCAEPPLILVCVSKTNEFCSSVEHNQVFCVNLLSDDQKAIAMVFAGHSDNPNEDRFATGEWSTEATGSPILSDAAVSLDCVLSSAQLHGTHYIYTGRVVGVAGNDSSPLVYRARSFTKIASI